MTDEMMDDFRRFWKRNSRSSMFRNKPISMRTKEGLFYLQARRFFDKDYVFIYRDDELVRIIPL